MISGSNLSDQFNLSLTHFGLDISFNSNLEPNLIEDDEGIFGFLKVMGGGGLFGGGVAGGLALLGLGFLPRLLAGLAAGGVIGWLFGSNSEEIILQMKREVYTKGFEKFDDSLEQIKEKISEGAIKAIDSRCDKATKAIQYSISILDRILIKNETVYRESVNSHDVKKGFIRLKTVELDCVDSNLRSLLLTTD